MKTCFILMGCVLGLTLHAQEPSKPSAEADAPAKANPLLDESIPAGKRTHYAAAFEYILLTGKEERYKNIVREIIGSFRRELPHVPQKFWQEYEAGVPLDEPQRIMAKFYVERFTLKELTMMNTFYRSDLGRKVIATNQELEKSFNVATLSWARKVKDNLVASLGEKRYLFR